MKPPSDHAGVRLVAGPAADPTCYVPWAADTKFFKYPAKPGPYRIALANGFIANATPDNPATLAYARSRHQDSDYGRMVRQQQVLLALRAQLQPCRMLPKLPSLLPAIKRSLWTTLSVGDLHVEIRELCQRLVPTRFQGARDDTILWLDSIVLALDAIGFE